MRLGARTLFFRKVVFGCALVLTISSTVFAQSNQPAWQPTHPSNDPNADKSQNDPKTDAPLAKGFTRPAGCTGERLVSQQLVALCIATSTGFFWRWWDFDIYVCTPDETPAFRRIQYTRTTDVPCKKTMWEITKKVGKSYGEDWIVNNAVFNSEEIADPPNGTDGPPPIGDGSRPDGRNAEATKATELAKAIDEKTNPKTEAKTETRIETKTEKKTGGGEKRPRKEVKATPRQRRARANSDPSANSQTGVPPEAIGTAVGIGLGVGLGMGRGGMMRDGGSGGDMRR
jgi:hypothetical protein